MTVPPDEARAMWLCETCGYMSTGPTCSRWRCGGSAKRVDEARKLLDDLSEIVAEESFSIFHETGSGKYDRIAALLRERHASWEGWKR